MKTENRFVLAGWVSIAAAVAFGLSWILAGMEESLDLVGFSGRHEGLGISDFLFLIFAALSIYVFYSLKGFLYERYSYRNLNLVIWIMITWHMVFYVGSFLLEAVASSHIVSPDFISGTTIVFWIMGVAVFGIIDIALAFTLLRDRSRFGKVITIFAILNLILGIFEATVILSVLALILAPLTYIALAFAFLSRQESLEFV